MARDDPAAWRAARARWEQPAQTAWKFGDLPERVPVAERAGVTVWAYPGLRAAEGGVELRLFKTPEEARAATRGGLAALLERELGSDLGWTERDLRALRELGALAATLAPTAELQAQALASIRRWVTDPGRIGPSLTAASFAAAVARAKSDLRGIVPRLTDQLREILELRQALLVHPTPPPDLAEHLGELMPPDFLGLTPYAQLAQFPRYLKAIRVRADRWRKNSAKDAERAAQLAPYRKEVARRRAAASGEAAARLRWLVEEFRVSLFAQELGTAEPVSAVKLDRLLAGRADELAPRESSPAAKPIVTAPVAAAKSAPLKTLSALDRLFPR